MSDCCVLVADSARARIFALRGDIEAGYSLIEMNSLTNPEGKASDEDLWSETQPGGHSSPMGVVGHGYEDHRERQRAEHERAFAKRASSAALQACAEENANELVVVSAKHMLGMYREALDDLSPSFLVRHDIGRELTRLTPHQLVEHLLGEGLIGKKVGQTPV